MNKRNLIVLTCTTIIFIYCASTKNTLTNTELKEKWGSVDKTSQLALEDFEKIIQSPDQQDATDPAIRKQILEELKQHYSQFTKKNQILESEEILQRLKSKYKKISKSDEEILIYDLVSCNKGNSSACKIIEEFDLAFKNKTENKNILNFNGGNIDEFEYQNKKEIFKQIQSLKYIILKLPVKIESYSSNGYFYQEYIKFENFNFQKNILPVRIDYQEQIESRFGSNPLKVDYIKSDLFQLPIEPINAKNIKNSNCQIYFLISVKPLIKKIDYYEVSLPGKSSYLTDQNEYDDLKKTGKHIFSKKLSSNIKFIDAKILDLEIEL